MPLQKLQFRPGIVRDATDYTNEGGWRDGDKIRFRLGMPETIGGWTKLTSSPMLGTCRDLHPWTNLIGTRLVGAGTNQKLYVLDGAQPIDITPIRRSVTLGANPIVTVNVGNPSGNGYIKITDSSNGVFLGDYVTLSGATAVGGITAAQINKEHQVVEVVDANKYIVDTGGTATSLATGGGASVAAAYQINTGLDSAAVGSGWGAGVWGRGAWNSAASVTIPGANLRLWSMDNFGEDLLANPRGGGIYYWDTSAGTSSRAVNITSISGNAQPQAANIVLVSERDRHVIAFGCDPEADPGVLDPLTIRFSDQESFTDWAATATNTAGELRIGTGSEIVAAVQTKQQVVVFTDRSVSAMQFIGAPFIFGLSEVSTNTSILSQNAAVAVGDAVYWMGNDVFYRYDGNVSLIPCPVEEYVFNNVNTSQISKVTAGSNTEFNEVWWFYPSASSQNNDRYVVYNYAEKIWFYGTIDRTAWDQGGVSGLPIAASPDGNIYFHETGFSDGSTNPPSPLNSYIESSGVDIGDGEQFMSVKRVIPDIGFRNSTGNPLATFTLNARTYPGSGTTQTQSGSAVRTVSSPIAQYTEQLDVRMRGRAVSIKVESNQVDTQWRLGTTRIDLRPDGRR
jgi:hypothetical protein